MPEQHILVPRLLGTNLDNRLRCTYLFRYIIESEKIENCFIKKILLAFDLTEDGDSSVPISLKKCTYLTIFTTSRTLSKEHN